jgi:pimeloyl-ACP methyl ester carboxylesterase
MARHAANVMKTAIVWIHGYPHSSKIFEPQLEIPGYKHICPDLRGFGKAPKPDGPMTMRDYSRDVLEAAGDEPAVFAGVSMGGYIAMQIYRDAPERVRALILLDTRETPDTEEGRAARMRTIEEIRRDGTERVIEELLPKMIATESLRPAARKIFESASPEGMIAALQAMADRPDSTDTLRNATVPALIMTGDKDPITPPTDGERMVALMRDAEFAPIANAAHLANFERSDQVNHIIEAWLARKV